MAATLLISDLHLAPSRPESASDFHALTRNAARGASAFYVLGDLFDAWIGDDELREPFTRQIADSLAAVATAGTPVWIQRGNRDFLLGDAFARASGARYLDDIEVHKIEGEPTILMHGDLLCTDDVDYLKFRAWAHDPGRQRRALALPYVLRRGISRLLRAGSKGAKSRKPEAVMDVNAEAVASTFRKHGYARMIHGHTHRPAHHIHAVDGRECHRWVLGDWYGAGSYLEITAEGVASRALGAAPG